MKDIGVEVPDEAVEAFSILERIVCGEGGEAET